MAQHTPMIQQYLGIKAQYKDAFLFFRLGDFYELFFEDAKLAAKELEITLTGRGGGEDRIPMCGVPYHSAEQYITQLIEKGYKVALCEQVEDPREAKGVVKREVVKLITPGTVMDGKTIADKENNFITSVSDLDDGRFGFVRTDLTTGESSITVLTGGIDEVIYELASTAAKEVIVSPDFNESYLEMVKQRLAITISFEADEGVPEFFKPNCEGIEHDYLVATIGRLCNYLVRTQRRSLDHLQQVQYYTANQYMKIDYHSKRNLELIETIREKKKKGSLLWIVDATVTAMGARLLKKWLERPLINQGEIEERLTVVETLMEQFFAKEELREALTEVYDLERLAGKVAYGNVNARELVQLRRSLQQVPKIVHIVQQLNVPLSERLITTIDHCDELLDLLETSIVDDPPLSVKDGGMIKAGFNRELDTYRDASLNGKTWIAALEQRERQETGIKSLKIGYNKVFGYYIEVTKSNIPNLPEGRYERKQTLANAERYITPELKEKETLILEAEEKIELLEYDLFQMIREQVKSYIRQLQQLAKTISTIDVLQSFATISNEQHFVRPQFTEDRQIQIENGRHPVVEKMIDRGQYVSNDVVMDREREILLITGPNMAGKSTYMRQLALTSIMAQVGCFVPATTAVLPIFDQIFTRIGAADDLASGQSTFMVEMLETKHALTNATENSLILLDEIGRGTSTYDGMALAQAIVEYIHEQIGAKTLFSTHYHELTALEQQLERLKNVHVSAIEEDGKVVFLHKVVDGQADRSYGIYVAQLAELPEHVIVRADEILHQLEGGEKQAVLPAEPKKELKVHEEKEEQPVQLSLFGEEEQRPKRTQVSYVETGIIKDIKMLDILNMTPFEALQMLNDIQRKLRK
ncbi:DNA mismatch repair protein MutS [Alkalihalobacterium chitinilyticum]|uniref:DNA mismatch repair protein MutS n=1 Tax=Alkalihalobacterium chitinilyticum TaxID=2980103 RepID=A0ABT5VBP9_9BACI|nr:DNA mismatch repair protein MutS [Alkalihalobacterium chitinilyticum]MDE5412881.1 DNA mismatch repair protein MutS [Alkalihalobacterium chitinilyticum]